MARHQRSNAHAINREKSPQRTHGLLGRRDDAPPGYKTARRHRCFNPPRADACPLFAPIRVRDVNDTYMALSQRTALSDQLADHGPVLQWPDLGTTPRGVNLAA